MKKLLVLTAFILGSYSIFSQELGVRGGSVLGNNIAIDAMLRSGKFNRLHVRHSRTRRRSLAILAESSQRAVRERAFRKLPSWNEDPV